MKLAAASRHAAVYRFQNSGQFKDHKTITRSRPAGQSMKWMPWHANFRITFPELLPLCQCATQIFVSSHSPTQNRFALLLEML
ncbi:hypothetical protein F9K97_20220 [Brucella anthropi]|uniref:Uncharacterized protein n=1 Tax=Brucella anthropi TaxID=529 RepID=A0A6I0D973_BRUAN|nr:hypothetical protein F9L04_21835 [Brucella anthropi]KAB2781881.1 hypothetical protein F9K97_20220 [Brucella anthropi]